MSERLRLQNPPLVEIWAEFKFLPSDPEALWTADVAEAFLNGFEGRFKTINYNINWETQIQAVVEPAGRNFRPLDPHVSFNALRASAGDSREWMVLGKDTLLFSLVVTPGYQPGYTALKEEASEALDRYSSYFQPTHIIQASLHYRDILKLPTDSKRLQPDRYLTIGIRAPDWVRVPVGSALLDISFIPHEDNLLRLRVQSQPSEDEFARFRMDWHLTCQRIQSTDRGVIWGRLDAAHERLIDNFWQSFTPEGQRLLGRIQP